MLSTKTFIKKTKRGNVMKVVREHYLRTDIWCGSKLCLDCHHEKPILERNPANENDSFPYPHYVVPDTNILIHQIDVLEDPSFKNVIILQTVLQETRNRNLPIYKRVQALVANEERHFYTFINDHHKDTFIEREPGESSNDWNDRAIRKAVEWYQMHLGESDMRILLLTDDAANLAEAKTMGLNVLTLSDYVSNQLHLADRLEAKESKMNAGGKNAVVYPDHLNMPEIQKRVKNGSLLQGVFHASRDNYLEGQVNAEDDDVPILIQSRTHLNRAVSGDVVAVQLLSKEEWKKPSDIILQDEGSNDPDACDEDTSEKVVEEESKEESKEDKRPTGKIVGIVKRNWRPYCGILLESSFKSNSTRRLFVPTDKRVPRIVIETRQGDLLKGQFIVVCIDKWPQNSRYPRGHYVRTLGPIGDKDTGNEILLLEHEVPHQEFSNKVLSFLPKIPWSIKETDMELRKDLRNLTICSVDPPGCTDIDDALHCRVLPNGNFEVGVHIADVSHFIRPGNALDVEAASRSTTVYLVDKRIDMVPELLSSNLCSLRSNEDRLAFSCIWEMTSDAEIVNVEFTKSAIRSCASLTYAEAQLKIDDAGKTDDLTESLRRLNRLAKILKMKRLDNGALVLASSEIRFMLDSETCEPIDVEEKVMRDTNSMVEEFMLLANISVAEKIVKEFPECAVLRRHPSPPPSKFESLILAAKIKGFTINVDSGKALSESLDTAVLDDNPFFNTMLRMLTTRCMLQAVYFCSGTIDKSEFTHYGLAVPIYTHFTSPIRRYADIMVHRLLAACIGADSTYPNLLNKKKTEALTNNMNHRHRMAQYAGRASISLNAHIFFKTHRADEEGYVFQVRKNALQIMVPRFKLEVPLLIDRKDPNVPSVYDKEGCAQTIGGVTLKLFDRVIVQIHVDNSNVQHEKLIVHLVEPKIANFSVSSMSSDVDEPSPKRRKLK